MKKFFAFILMLIVTVTLFTGCGIVSGNEPPDEPDTPDQPDVPVKPDPDLPEDGAFTVRLTYGDQPYIPDSDAGIGVIWTGETDGSIHTAEFGEDGVARIGNLDGDYRVILTASPEGLTYNANAYRATNDSPDVTIELERLIRVSTVGGKGSTVFNPLALSTSGVYRLTIKSATDEVYCSYAPSEEGKYVIESWVDAVTNEVNPLYDEIVYSTGTVSGTIDDGGISSTYTKNFQYTVNVDKDAVGRAYRFGVRAESRTGVFPVSVDIVIRYLRPADEESIPFDIILPQEDFEARQADFAQKGMLWSPSMLGYTFTHMCDYYGILDGSRVKLNPADGLYHLYDEQSGEYREILYAKISENIPFSVRGRSFQLWDGDSFITMEYHGNKALTVYDKDVQRGRNYKLFIEGYANLPEDWIYPNYVNYPGQKGYNDYVTVDGCYPVTQELQRFLMEFSLSQRYFNDGNGFAEGGEDGTGYYGMKASEDDQWLFACGYYNGYVPQ